MDKFMQTQAFLFRPIIQILDEESVHNNAFKGCRLGKNALYKFTGNQEMIEDINVCREKSKIGSNKVDGYGNICRIFLYRRKMH